MSYKSGSQKPKSYKAEDSAEVVNIDFRKVSDLDITVRCSICNEPVHISHLFHHKKAHQAQAVLGYRRPWIDPIDIKKTNLQRDQLILRMRKIAKYPERQIEKICCSYDFLKETLKNAPYFCIKSVAESSVQSKVISNPLIKAIAICQDKNAIWHQHLEDVFVVIDNYGNRKDTCFLGLFDGANGISAAQTTSAEFPLLLLDQLSHGDSSYELSQAERKVLNSFCTIFRADYKLRELIFTARRVKSPKTHEWIHRAYAKAFWRMDRLLRLGRNETSRVRWSSCTAITCLVETISNKNQKQDEEGEKSSETLSHGKQPNDTEQEEELSERIKGAKRKSNIVEETGSTTEQQREELIESRNEEKQVSIQEEEELPKEMSRANSSIEHGMGNIIENQRNEPLGNTNGKKEENIVQQEEELSERIHGAEKKSSREEEIRSSTEQQGEKPIERKNEEEEQIQREEKELSKEMSRENRKSNTEQGLGEIEMQREEPPENMNDKKEKNMQKKEELSERITGAKTKSNTGQGKGSITDYQREEPNERMIEDAENHSVVKQEKELPENIIKGNRTSNMQQETGSSIMEKPRMESTEGINATKKEEDFIPQEEEQQAELTVREEEKGTIDELQEEPWEINKQMTKAEVEQSINHKDEIQEVNPLENIQSSDEPSVGVMHIANIGNVHAVLCKNGESYWLTKEHTTYCRKEKIRVIRNDGNISSNEPKGLIEGLTKNTRALGHHGNPQLKETVIPVPHTISFPVDDSCQFLILATNGLWEVLDRGEVVQLTLTMFSAYLQRYHHQQQRKRRRMSKVSKFSLRGMEDEFHLWYSNQDFFKDRDKNLSQNNVPLPPIKSVTGEKTPIQSKVFIMNSEDEESESLLEPPSISLSSSEDTAERLGSAVGSGAPSTKHDDKSDESSQISEDLEGNSRTFYDLAAKYISKHLVSAALKAGSRDNITVLVVLLNGCDKIPTYFYNL
ncbi:protein phosphatase 2C-like domain-containing protein 1 [Anolis carolinensis]|uniref:protein phosphatase 2C-like domain-containing protein 1 n=1 Tax=Anolis carolinensis TaxID=28377 RepID=UPI002F2B22D9